MLRSKIKIGDGDSVDSTTYGLVYLDSDKRVGSSIRQFEAVSYPERDGEDVLAKSTLDPFDYKVKFFIQPGTYNNTIKGANDLISAFNSLLYDEELLDNDTDVKTFKPVEFINIYKKHKIKGIPYPIDLATEFWRDPTNTLKDIVVVEWTIRVSRPQDCDFNYTEV